MEKTPAVTIINPANTIRLVFYEEVLLLGRVISSHKGEEDMAFRLAKMLDWVYRRHTGQIGRFENETIEMLLKQSYKPHLSTIYLLERHFPEINLCFKPEEGGDGGVK